MVSISQMESIVSESASALGYGLVDLDRSGLGVMRVFIERGDGEPVTVEDCEKLSHQLSHVFEVENVDYDRLEVSSPGLDRPLKSVSDFARFVGREANVKLRMAVAGRRSFVGLLVEPSGDQVGLDIESPGNAGRSLLKFKIAEVEKARLVPKIDFKRKAR
ncbi:ribosome maturation factor RimP [soil metagenome]